MIQLTKLNGKLFYLNAIYIETVEEFPDTTISLTDGKKYIVREKAADVAKKAKLFYRDIQMVGMRGDGGDTNEK